MTKCITERNYLLPDDLDEDDFNFVSILSGRGEMTIGHGFLRLLRGQPRTGALLTASFYQTQAIMARLIRDQQ